jgi:hypothetical protein
MGHGSSAACTTTTSATTTMSIGHIHSIIDLVPCDCGGRDRRLIKGRCDLHHSRLLSDDTHIGRETVMIEPEIDQRRYRANHAKRAPSRQRMTVQHKTTNVAALHAVDRRPSITVRWAIPQPFFGFQFDIVSRRRWRIGWQ